MTAVSDLLAFLLVAAVLTAAGLVLLDVHVCVPQQHEDDEVDSRG